MYKVQKPFNDFTIGQEVDFKPHIAKDLIFDGFISKIDSAEKSKSKQSK